MLDDALGESNNYYSNSYPTVSTKFINPTIVKDDDELEIRTIDDLNELMRFEYFVQLSFFTPDLHIVSAWKLNNEDEEKKFSQHAHALCGPVLNSLIEISELVPENSFEEILKKKKLNKDGILKNNFVVGAHNKPKLFETFPTARYRFILFKIATGRTFLHNKDFDTFETSEIPAGYTSIMYDDWTRKHSQSHYRTLYRIKRLSELFPFILLEVDFKPLRIEVTYPSCEICVAMPAEYYCPNDKAHFCSKCDHTHHSSSRLLSRHTRVSVNESPYQFGKCSNHPSETLENVCMICFLPLCSHCCLIGQHSSTNFSNHTLVSTIDAYRMARQGNSPSEENLWIRRKTILDEICTKHRQLAHIQSNFNSISLRIDNALEQILKEVCYLKDKKLSHLNAFLRQLRYEELIIMWMEAFFLHLRMALNASDFLLYKKKHDLLAKRLFGSRIRVLKAINDFMPPIILDKILIRGMLEITCRAANIKPLSNTCIQQKPASVIINDFIEKCKTKGELQTIETRDQKEGLLSREDILLSSSTKFINETKKTNKIDEEKEVKNDTLKAEWMDFPSDVDGTDISAKIPMHTNVLICPDKSKHDIVFEKSYLKAAEYQQNEMYASSVNDFSYQLEKNKQADEELSVLVINEKDKNLSIHSNFKEQAIIAKKLWALLSDIQFTPLLIILKSSSPMERNLLIRAAADLGNYFDSLGDLTKNLLKFEIEWLSDLPESLLYHTSTILSSYISHICSCSYLLTPGDELWLKQVSIPLINIAKNIVESNASVLDDETDDFTNLFPALETFLNNLILNQLCDIPSTLRSILYIITDCVDKMAPRTIILHKVQPKNLVSPAAISMCCETILSYVIASFLLSTSNDSTAVASYHHEHYNAYYKKNILSQEKIANVSSFHRLEHSKHFQLIRKLVRLLKIVSLFVWDKSTNTQKTTSLNNLKMNNNNYAAAADIEVGSAASNSHNSSNNRNLIPKFESAENAFFLRNANKVYEWMTHLLARPRLQSSLKFNKSSLPKAAIEAVKFFIDYFRRLDALLREGRFLPYGDIEVDELTKTYNFEMIINLSITSSNFFFHDF